jgi:hypothetical protein
MSELPGYDGSLLGHLSPFRRLRHRLWMRRIRRRYPWWSQPES